jgi:Flp pilus assembly protein TadG
VSSELRRRLRSQHGNTLLLMPAGILVLMILAAIAVDAAVLFLGQRRVADLAASVAQDAVAAVDEARFYSGELVLVQGDAYQRGQTLAANLPQDDALMDPSCSVETDLDDAGDPIAIVRCDAQVRFIFAPAIPGSDRIGEVSATETAAGRQG